MTRHLLFFANAAVLALGSVVSSQGPPAKSGVADKVDDVRVIGCLKREGADWLLTSATDPVPNVPPKPNAPAAAAPVAPSLPGRNQFKLIGVDVFHLDTRKDQRIEVTGLLLPAKPVSRINITTVVTVAPTCNAPGR